MAEPLFARTAFGLADPQVHRVGPVTISERVDMALASVAIRRGRADDVTAAAARAGIPLPTPARFIAGGLWHSFWTAPEMWFVSAPYDSHADIVAALKPVFGDAASITEQTDAWVRFDLAAPDLGPLLERLCNVDFNAAPDGFATRTVIDHLGCYLIRLGQGTVVLYGPRSSAASLLHALEVAAASLPPSKA